jgi:ADP-heptose:LPS heptosyltransferase
VTPARILVVKRDKIGDLLLTTPLIEHLRTALPGAEVHVLANDYNAWVVDGHPAITRLWVYGRTRHGGRVRIDAAVAQLAQFVGLRAQRFDVAIAAGGEESPRAIRRALAVGARRTIAYTAGKTRHGRRFTDPLPLPAGGHEIDRMLALALPLGVAPPEQPIAPSFRMLPSWQDAGDRWLAANAFAGDRFVVIGLGARDPEKQPSATQVLRWATRLHADWGLSTALQFTPGDAGNALYPGSAGLAAEILGAAPPWLKCLPPELPPVVGAIGRARASVLPDGGLMHIAASCLGGVVGLFAQPGRLSDPGRWGPVGPRAKTLTARRAIADLDTDEVLRVLAPLLDR